MFSFKYKKVRFVITNTGFFRSIRYALSDTALYPNRYTYYCYRQLLRIDTYLRAYSWSYLFLLFLCVFTSEQFQFFIVCNRLKLIQFGNGHNVVIIV